MAYVPGQTEQLSLLASDYDGASFSKCRTWRYLLWRRWSDGDMVAFILLNPSSATEQEEDPTIRRCIGFAKMWGMGGLYILNIFALRSTDPNNLYVADDPIGKDNDRFILDTCRKSCLVVCGWGNHGAFLGRGKHVMRLLNDNGIKAYCLGVNQSGEPKHPLYIGYSSEPMPYASGT